MTDERKPDMTAHDLALHAYQEGGGPTEDLRRVYRAYADSQRARPHRKGTDMTERDEASFRQERIEKLLHELRYEVERGLMEREIPEEMGFRFVFGVSHKIPNGVVACEFRMRPMPHYAVSPDDLQPRLRVVKS